MLTSKRPGTFLVPVSRDRHHIGFPHVARGFGV
jgi:hypothetical protein